MDENIGQFAESFASWQRCVFEPRVNELNFDEIVEALTPWVVEARAQVECAGLSSVGDAGQAIRQTLNAALDSCEHVCCRIGASFPEMMLRLEVEELLIGLEFVAEVL